MKRVISTKEWKARIEITDPRKQDIGGVAAVRIEVDGLCREVPNGETVVGLAARILAELMAKAADGSSDAVLESWGNGCTALVGYCSREAAERALHVASSHAWELAQLHGTKPSMLGLEAPEGEAR